MNLPMLFIAVLVIFIFGGTSRYQTKDDTFAVQRDEVLRRYSLDPTSSLESRVKAPSATALKMFEDIGQTPPTAHALTEIEQRKLSAAFAALLPLHQRVLRERLRSVSFLDASMPGTALTSTVNPRDSYKLFDITIRAAIFRQNASEWLTEKESGYYDAAGSSLRISIEAGERDAIVFVLLHEATHIVDSCLGITPPVRTDDKSASSGITTPFTDGVWSERTTPVPLYRDPLRERLRFRANGKILAIDHANSIYSSLSKTPFVSLYSSSNWYDDLAEYVAVFHWTEILKQPYKIVIRLENKIVFVYEPMKSDLVRKRVGLIKRFYLKQDTKLVFRQSRHLRSLLTRKIEDKYEDREEDIRGTKGVRYSQNCA
jgi:hypothetical protein